MEKEIILIDKPRGITSFDVIRILRKKLASSSSSGKPPRMGHAGTLDPLATGLMIIGVGDGTKRLKEYLKLPKTYESEILLGKRTTTGDISGKVVEEQAVGEVPREVIEKTVRGMVGAIKLPVPVYSAVKRGGIPLYAWARRGERVAPPIKSMEVLSADVSGVIRKEEGTIISVRWEVGSGTYIRSLAEELGRRLGYPATLWSLRRTRIGNAGREFRVEDAKRIDCALSAG